MHQKNLFFKKFFKFYRNLVWIISLFFFTVSANLFWASNYHSDERFYTDSAIIMHTSGNYWEPKYFNGELRLNKPLITYWVIAASYKIFGINLFSSRLPFILAGIGVVFITFVITYEWLKDKVKANIAALMIASNLQILELSGRSTPDILLIFSIALGWYGLIQPNIENINRQKAILGWIGIGLSVGIKGSLGILFIIFGLITHIFRIKYYTKMHKSKNHILDIKSKNLFPVIGLISCFIIAVTSLWPIVASFDLSNGSSDRPSFIADQFMNRPASSLIQVLENLIYYGLSPLRHFLIWTLILGFIFFKNFKTQKLENIYIKEKIKFYLRNLPVHFIWFFTLVIIFSFGNIDYSRYLAPCYPMLAVIFTQLIFQEKNLASIDISYFLSLRSLYICGVIWVGLCAWNLHLIQPKFNLSSEEQFVKKLTNENKLINAIHKKTVIYVSSDIKNIGLMRVLTKNQFHFIRAEN